MRLRARSLNADHQPRLWLYIVVLLLLAAYAIYFVSANSDEVSVSFLFVEARISLIWVILLSLAIGLVAGALLSQVYRRRHTRAASSATPSEIRSGDS